MATELTLFDRMKLLNPFYKMPANDYLPLKKHCWNVFLWSPKYSLSVCTYLEGLQWCQSFAALSVLVIKTERPIVRLLYLILRHKLENVNFCSGLSLLSAVMVWILDLEWFGFLGGCLMDDIQFWISGRYDVRKDTRQRRRILLSIRIDRADIHVFVYLSAMNTSYYSQIY